MKLRKSAIFKFEILGLIVNTLTADDKYSRRNIQNLTQELQTAISQKQKTFSGIFITCALNLKYFLKKDEYPTRVISRIIYSERGCYLNV